MDLIQIAIKVSFIDAIFFFKKKKKLNNELAISELFTSVS